MNTKTQSTTKSAPVPFIILFKVALTVPNQRQFDRQLNRRVAKLVKTHLADNQLAVDATTLNLVVDWKRIKIASLKDDAPGTTRFTVKGSIKYALTEVDGKLINASPETWDTEYDQTI